jgi:hypothetical protein
MPTQLDRAYQDPLDAAEEAILRASDSTKARLFDALQEATAAFLATVVAEAGASTLEDVINAGLARLSRQAVQAIQRAAEEAARRQAEAHAAGYAAAASAADEDVPDWEPGQPIVVGIERGSREDAPEGAVDPYQRVLFGGMAGGGDDDDPPETVEDWVEGAIQEEVSYFKQDLKYIRKYVSEDRYALAAAQVLARGNPDVIRRLEERGIDLNDFDTDDLIGRAAEVFQNTKTMGSPDIRGILEEMDIEDIAARDPDLYRRIKANGTDSLARVFDEIAKDLAGQSPAVELVQWRLSSRHDALASSPDSCDVLARADLYGFGDGLYHPKTVPAHPHPNCECSVEVVTRDPSEWSTQPNARPEGFQLDPENVQAILQQVKNDVGSPRSLTPAHIERVTGEALGVIRQVHQNPR